MIGSRSSRSSSTLAVEVSGGNIATVTYLDRSTLSIVIPVGISSKSPLDPLSANFASTLAGTSSQAVNE